VILPKATLEHLGVKQGQQVIAMRAPGGDVCSCRLAAGGLMAHADAYMDEHNATIGELARQWSA
jgi:antitoxin component of MazEF toxin-antitoxin module